MASVNRSAAKSLSEWANDTAEDCESVTSGGFAATYKGHGVSPPIRALRDALTQPVPSAGAIWFEMPEAGEYSVRVADLSGRLVLERVFSGKYLLLPEGVLPAGMFAATVWAGGRRMGTVKIVIIEN